MRSAIEAGDLVAGDRLMTERQLAETLGVSRSGVREGLAILRGQGFVALTSEGAVVRERGIEDVAEAFSSLGGTGSEEVLAMLEAREMLEARAASLAARRRTDADLLSLDLLAHRVREALTEGGDVALADASFHRSVVAAARNEILLRMFFLLEDALSRGYRPIRQRMLVDPTIRDLFLDQHEAIVGHLRRGDPGGAEEEIQNHLRLAVAFVVGRERPGGSAPAS